VTLERRPIPPHGLRARYFHRSEACRCEACREANARYMRAWRAGADTSPTLFDPQ
jgi:hypothetical protein